MNRRFLKPLLSFWDPFFAEPIYIRRIMPTVHKQNTMLHSRETDPHETFENFFKDHFENTSTLKPEERDFFQKHYPEKVAKKFNPHEVLGIEQGADLEKVKSAYRENAIRYHPKSNSSPEAAQKFRDISRAYNELINQVQTTENAEQVTTKSFFEDFQKQMEDSRKTQVTEKGKEKQENQTNLKKEEVNSQTEKQKTEVNSKAEGQDNAKNDLLKGAELYSESSFYESVNGKQKYHVTRMYEKNGKTIKVERTEERLADGKIEVHETFDDGKEIKNRKFIEAANKKQLYL